MKIEQIIEATFVLILVFLVVSNAFGFTAVVNAVSGAYVNAVKTLQGR